MWEECGKIIREVNESGTHNTVQKDKGDGPVTVADIRVQKTLEENLKHFYPSLAVLGEEEKAMTDKYESSVKPDQVIKTLIS